MKGATMAKFSGQMLGLSCVFTLATGCSDSDPAAPSGEEVDQRSYTKIDDMEGTTGVIDWTPPTGSPGFWYSYASVQCENLRPIPSFVEGTGGWSYAEVPEPYETFSGVTSRQAARLRTVAPLVDTWGAGMGFFLSLPTGSGPPGLPRECTYESALASFKETNAIPVDLTAYSGISFWARTEPNAPVTELTLELFDRNTHPAGGICNATQGTPDECYNTFEVTLPLTERFEHYVLDFSEFAQDPNWGYQVTSGTVDLTQMYNPSFNIKMPGGSCPGVCPGQPTLEFDIWIDDLYFVDR